MNRTNQSESSDGAGNLPDAARANGRGSSRSTINDQRSTTLRSTINDQRTTIFHSAVHSIVAAILEPRGASEQEVVAVNSFVLGQHARMPDYLRLPLLLVTLAFDAYPFVVRGRPFHRLELADRVRFLEAWKRGRLGVQRDLIKFYESLSVFGWHAEKYVDAPSS